MSQENVEIVHRSIDAFNRGDLEAALACLHPEGEVADDPRVPGGGTTHRGNVELAHLIPQGGPNEQRG
jgi:ketosteroid isomerase-like protein